MQPGKVISPQNQMRAGSLNVLFVSKDGWSFAGFDWLGDDGVTYRPAHGIRWNGDLHNPDDKGNPHSHGHGTWFILPEPIAMLVQALVAIGA